MCYFYTSFFKKGYGKIEKFVDPALLEPIRDELHRRMDLNNDMARINDHFAMVNQPWMTVPGVLELGLDDRILKIMTHSLGSSMGLGTCNLRHSFITPLKDTSTTMFHRDNNSKNFLKVFFYLNDVTDDADGPFTYVEGSHILRKETGYTIGSRWPDDQIEELYGKTKIIPLRANMGDLLIANTTGFHKGLQCSAATRGMLTLNYTTEAEKFGKFKITQAQLAELCTTKQQYCKYLDIV